MDLLVLAGFRGVRITQIWAPGDRDRVGATTGRSSRTSPAAAKLDHVTVLTSVIEPGQPHDAAHRRRTRRTSPRMPPSSSQAVPDAEDRDRRQRAEPQPLLAAAVQRRRQRRRGAGVREPARAHVRRGEGRVAGIDRARRRGLAARRRRRRRHPADALADRVHPRPRQGVPRQRPDGADHGRLRLPPVRGQLERRARRRGASEHDDDRARRLRQARRAPRRGVRRTAYSTLPIWYDEFGVESQIPPAKQALYTGTEPATTKPVAEATQAAYYRQAVQLVFCQPNVRGLFLFHTVDEKDLAGWQSGLYYADGTPKSSLAAVEARARRVAARRRRALRRPRAAGQAEGRAARAPC